VAYRSSDGYGQSRTFKTLTGAQRYAQRMVGETPEVATGYAVSPDGIGRITCAGVALPALFPKAAWRQETDFSAIELRVAAQLLELEKQGVVRIVAPYDVQVLDSARYYALTGIRAPQHTTTGDEA
jgi:hypothetical protein